MDSGEPYEPGALGGEVGEARNDAEFRCEGLEVEGVGEFGREEAVDVWRRVGCVDVEGGLTHDVVGSWLGGGEGLGDEADLSPVHCVQVGWGWGGLRPVYFE